MKTNKSKNQLAMEDLEKQLDMVMKFLIWQMDNAGKFGEVSMINSKDSTNDILEKLSEQLTTTRTIIKRLDGERK